MGESLHSIASKHPDSLVPGVYISYHRDSWGEEGVQMKQASKNKEEHLGCSIAQMVVRWPAVMQASSSTLGTAPRAVLLFRIKRQYLSMIAKTQ
jgi:hypothetical protein